MRRFAISDIHGCNKTFNEALNQIGLNKRDQLFLLGDYIDRGPDSKDVLDTIFKLIDDGYDVTCLKGNHEQMLLDSISQTSYVFSRMWLTHGGEQTIASFGGFEKDKITPKYRDFLTNLKHYHVSENDILVHAGLDFKIYQDPLQDEHSMLWSRKWYKDINYKWLGDRTIIHGHTPMSQKEIVTMNDNILLDKVLDIDCGCYYQDMDGMGYLCVVELNDKNLFFQKNVD